MMGSLYKHVTKPLGFLLPTFLLEDRGPKTQALCAGLFPRRRQDQASRQSSRGREHGGHSQSGQQPLKAIRQMPQFSSLATQSQVATPFQHLIFTFMAVEPASRGKRWAGYVQPAQLQHLGPHGSRGSGTDAQAEKSRGVSTNLSTRWRGQDRDLLGRTKRPKS